MEAYKNMYDYTYTYSGGSSDTAETAFLAAYFGAILIFSVIPSILTLIGTWKTYTKMGEPGWKCLIPIYSYYVICERCSTKKNFIMTLVSAGIILFSTLFFIGGGSAVIIGVLLYLGGLIMSLVYIVKIFFDLSKSFGYSAAFGIGLILLPYIFFMILAFGSSQYNGNINEISYNDKADYYGGYSTAGYQNYSNNSNRNYQNNNYSNNMGNSYQNNGYSNNMNNGYQNNGYSNNMNNSYQNNGSFNNMNSGYQSNGYSNNMNNSFQNNNFNSPVSAQPKDMADLEVPVVDDSAFEQYERSNGRKPNNDNFMNGI